MPEPAASHVARNVLQAEHVRNTYLIDVTRFVGVATITVVSCALDIVFQGPGWHTIVPYLLVYAAVSAVLFVRARQRTAPARFAGLMIAVWDIPIVFLLQRASLATSPHPGGVAGFTLAVFALLLVIASMSQNENQVTVGAVVAAVLEVVLQHEAGVQVGAMITSCIIVAILAAVNRHNIHRLNRMARRIDDDLALRERIEADQQTLRQRLSQSERLAALGTLAASVAHEINNPLAYILANLELMAERMRAFEPGGHPVWSSLGENVKRALDQVDSLLRAPNSALPSQARHDLRNILTPVYVNLDALAEQVSRLGNAIDTQRDTPTQELRTLLQRARDGGERLRLITRNLKSLSRSDDTAIGPLQLRDVMESCVGMAEAEIQHHARLERRYDDIPDADGNPVLLGQVLLNLLINAAQAIPDGHADSNTITVGTCREADGSVAAYVRDTGAGIAPEVRERIFEPFFTTKPVGVGTGLGLHICRSIVESLKGRIVLESEVGKGTTFKVVLPASASEPVRAPLPPAPTPPARRRGRVMVIDDEVMIGEVLRQVLEREHAVTVFTNGKQALECLTKGGDFDVILCDLTMPIMTAAEFYEALTRLDPRLADKVVFTTGGAYVAANQAFLHTIPNLCLEKPFDIGELRQVVHEFVTGPR